MPKLKFKQYVLIDMNWWASSTRRRGIGIYLLAFFNGYFNWKDHTPLWCIPSDIDRSDLMELKKTFTGGEFTSNHSQDYSHFYCETGKIIKANQICYALSGSPFERKSSLLNDVVPLLNVGIPLHVVIHDLLPLVFRKKILDSWRSEDQILYLHQIKNLEHVSKLLATGSAAYGQIAQSLPTLINSVSVIPFGETSSWIKIPKEIDSHHSLITSKYAVTISGGEWRKNLHGTLLFFSLFFPKPWKIVIICELGKVERIKFMYLAYKLGIMKRVIFTGRVSEQIKWNYLAAMDVLISLSFGEGLNLPVREAQRIGKPVIQLEDARAYYLSHI